MAGLLAPIVGLFKFHKFKMFIVGLFVLLFGMLTFPYGDLAGILPTRIYEWSGNQVYVQFEDFGVSLIPLAITMEEVLIEPANVGPIQAEHLEVSPALLDALLAKTGASIDASGLFDGVVAADYHEGDSTKAGNRIANVGVNAQGLSLPRLSTYLRENGMLPLDLKGSVDISTNLQLDALFNEQPTGEIETNFKNLGLAAQVFPSMMGPLPIPELKMGTGKLTARMRDGTLDITELSFGGPRESLAGRIRGQLGMVVRRDATGVRPQIGNMDLVIDLTLKTALMQDSTIKAALALAQAYAKPVADGVRYNFRVKKSPSQMLPEFSAVQ